MLQQLHRGTDPSPSWPPRNNRHRGLDSLLSARKGAKVPFPYRLPMLMETLAWDVLRCIKGLCRGEQK